MLSNNKLSQPRARFEEAALHRLLVVCFVDVVEKLDSVEYELAIDP